MEPTRLARHIAAITGTLAMTLANASVAPRVDASQSGMEEVVVRGQYLSIDKVNAVKTPTPLVDVPQSLSILSSEQITDQAFVSMGDVLRYTPGLSVSQGEGHRDAMIIRGVQTTADFFIDGVRDDVQYYRPLYNVEQIEVLRGANALLFGRGGGGGVINRVQKKPVADAEFARVNAGVDTFGAWSVAADGNLAPSDGIAFRLNAYYQELDNHRDFFDGSSFALNPSLTIDLSDRTSAFLSYEYVDDDRVVDRGVPSRSVDGGPDEPLRGYTDTFFGSPDENLTTFQGHILRARLEHEFADQLRGNVTVQYADYDKVYQNLYPSDAVDVTGGVFPTIELDGYRDTTERQNLILQANLVGEFETGRFRHTLLAGAEFGDQDTGNDRRDNVFAANGDDQLAFAFSDPLEIPDFGFTSLSRDRESTVRFASFYVQDQIDVTSWAKVVLGFRHDTFDIEVLDRIEASDGDAVDGDFERKDQEITPRLGLILKPQESLSFYLSYSETFLPQSGDQFLTLNLDTQSTRPQFFENTEIGVKWDVRDDLAVTAALFELERESFTTVDPDDQDQLLVVDGSVTRGFELQLTGTLTDRWWITTGYSWLDGEVRRAGGGGNDGNATRQTPTHMFSVWNDVRVTERLRVGIGATYQDAFFVIEDNNVEVPAYTRIDAAAYYDLNDRTRLQLNVENLFDETWFPDAHSNTNITTGRPLSARFSVVVDL